MKISAEQAKHINTTFAAMDRDRQSWVPHWRQLANYILPRRYTWLETENQRASPMKTQFIIDGTATQAARVLAAGMLNGVTSPARPWMRVRLSGFDEETMSYPARQWVDEVTRRMLFVMAETNFYSAMAVMYLDLCVFGTAAMLIYEDFDSVFRCYNSPLGEFYIAAGDNGQPGFFSRKFQLSCYAIVKRFGLENCSETIKNAWQQGGGNLHKKYDVYHLIEPNPKDGSIPPAFLWRETYWEAGSLQRGEALQVAGFYDKPAVTPRWEVTGNDSYGVSPGMDALPDTKQLQHESKKKAQALDKMVDPPIQADMSLAHRPTALHPRGVTFVSGTSQVGVKPVYTVTPPLGEMTMDIQDVRTRIREIFHNDLFKMISQLDTVRSATEIDARREEKLVLLGSVLERFENEALDPVIRRIYSIMDRVGLIPEPPPDVDKADIKIEYVSILSEAQRAVGTAPIERFLQVIGNMAAIYGEAVTDIPDVEAMLREYADKTGVPIKTLRSRAEYAKMQAQKAQAAAMQQMAEVGAPAAKQLSETELGGGRNALQAML